MILGIGVDICNIKRIERNSAKITTLFSNYILTKNEVKESELEKNFVLYLASRFSAKESFYKAFNTPNQKFITWQDIEILKIKNNKQKLFMSKKGIKLLKDFLPIESYYKIDLSIGYRKDLVISNTIISYF